MIYLINEPWDWQNGQWPWFAHRLSELYTDWDDQLLVLQNCWVCTNTQICGSKLKFKIGQQAYLNEFTSESENLYPKSCVETETYYKRHINLFLEIFWNYFMRLENPQNIKIEQSVCFLCAPV